MKLLVSVRDPAEALIAARGGADYIDLKEPGLGALGGLPVATIEAIVGALRAAGFEQAVSATIGDVPMHERATIRARVAAVGATGVDIVKVGIERGEGALDVLRDLAQSEATIVPVFIADRGLDEALVAAALELGFAGVMADTADKRAGSLFDAAPGVQIERFVAQARAAGVPVGLAGALRLADAPRLAALDPDFAGFRSAVCAGDRAGALDAARLQALVETMRAAQCVTG